MKKRVLIVEDEVIIAGDIKRILERFGYEVPPLALTGEDAIKSVEENPPDIVLMDIYLGSRMDGIETARQITARFKIPILYLTSHTDMDILERAKIAEPYALITKPFKKRELYNHIEIALHKHQVEKQAEHLKDVLTTIKNVSQLIAREKNSRKLVKEVCDLLIDTKDYFGAWITFGNGAAPLELIAHSGREYEQKALEKKINSGDIPECLRQTLNRADVVVITDFEKSCPQCPCFEYHRGKGVLSVRLSHENRVYGTLTVSIPIEFTGLDEEKQLIKGMADDIAFALNKIRLEQKQTQLQEQLRALNSHIISVREEERIDIARKLHDELSPALTLMKIQLVTAANKLTRMPPADEFSEILKKLADVEKTIDHNVHLVRNIISDLRPGILDDLGLVPALEWLAGDFGERTGVPVHFSSRVRETDLDRDESTAVFRIVQEAVTNAIRHGSPTGVTLHLRPLDRNLQVEIIDNGTGMDPRKANGRKSFGILGMKERAASFGWQLSIGGAPGSGTTVTLNILKAVREKLIEGNNDQ